MTSPGEPFHTIDAGREWLVNWFNVQQSGKMLFGPSPRTLIPTITVQEVQEELRDQLLGWQSRVRTGSGQGFLAYAILTVCRAWCTITHKTVRSKVQSGALVGQEFPQWAELVNQAVEVRANRGHDGDINPDDAARFVDDIARHLVGASWDGGR